MTSPLFGDSPLSVGCPKCGQPYGWACVGEVGGRMTVDFHQERIDAYEHTRVGPTAEMHMKLDAEIEKVGGRLPWTGIWPGVEECVEFGWYSKRVAVGYRKCEKDDPRAGPSLNRLSQDAIWSREKRRWVLPS